MEGNTGRLFRELSVALAGAVAISAFVALTLTPMMCSKLLRPHARVRARPRRAGSTRALHARRRRATAACSSAASAGRWLFGGHAWSARSSPSVRAVHASCRANWRRRRIAARSSSWCRARKAPASTTPCAQVQQVEKIAAAVTIGDGKPVAARQPARARRLRRQRGDAHRPGDRAPASTGTSAT